MRLFLKDMIDDVITNDNVTNCIGEILNKTEYQKLKLDNVKFCFELKNKDNQCFGYCVQKDDKKGAIDVNGDIFAKFIYEDVFQINDVNDLYGNFYAYKKIINNVELYDIYYNNNLLVYESQICTPIICDNDIHNNRFLLVSIREWIFDNHYAYNYKILDLDKYSYLNTKILNYVIAISLKHNEMIVSDHDNFFNQTFSQILNFNGASIYDTFSFKYKLKFTELKGYYECIDNDNKHHLLINENEILQVEYKEMLQIFKNKIVVIDLSNRVRVIYLEKNNKNGYTVKLDNYKFPKEIKSVFFLEDESEAILTFMNDKKMLLSHYLQQYNENYFCDEIIYKGNDVFECIQFKNNDKKALITYFFKGMSVLYKNTDEKPIIIHNQKLNTVEIVYSNGDVLFQNNENLYLPKEQNNSYKRNDFMTIKKEGSDMLIKIETLKFFSTSAHNMYWNLYTRENYFNETYKFGKPELIFHNLYKNLIGCFKLKDSQLLISNADNIFSFNHFVLIIGKCLHSTRAIVLDINLDTILSVENDSIWYNKNSLNNEVVFGTKDNAFRITNDDLIYQFSYFETIKGKPTYKEINGDNFIINSIYVKKTELDSEISKGYVSPDYLILLQN